MAGEIRVAIFWSMISGYLAACLRTLSGTPGAKLLAVYRQPQGDAPFDESRLGLDVATVPYSDSPVESELRERLEDFQPDVIVINSWHIPAFRRVAKQFRGKATRLMFMDNQWHGTLKQWLGVLTSPVYIRPYFDAAFVPGDNQAEFARRLGFSEDRIVRGGLSCDYAAFRPVGDARLARATADRAFVFTARLVPVKAIDVLAEGYQRYRREVDDPWPLVICGVGPEDHRLEGIPGVERLGFVQPADLPGVFARASCLVMPSRFEPWGVAIHEATAAGQAVICTDVCGAVPHLARPGINGWVIPGEDAGALSRAMAEWHRLDEASKAAYAAASVRLSEQFTPEKWAQAVIGAAGLR